MHIRLLHPSLTCHLSLCGVLALASAATAAEPAAPKCALIDVGKSPFAAVVETRLLERENTEWLERNQVDLLLAEQQLQALFAADATGARAAIGKLLKADLLVVLRTGEREKLGDRQKQKYADLVVAETAGGLRLIARQVPLGEDAEADVETLVGLVDQALAKHREKISAVYAVPPFVSQDLTYEHDHLKTAYARLLEQVFLEQPGVLVVEFAEAESLVREFQLAAPDQRLERRLPVYLLGEYRHDGRDEEQTVTVSLQVKSGDTVSVMHKQTLPPDKAPGILREAAGKLIPSERHNAAIVAPEVEARQLAQRADSFFKLGEWSEALSLMEASLLLNPDQPEVRRNALRVAGLLATACDPRYEESFGDRLRFERRALEHFRQFIFECDARHVYQESEMFRQRPTSHLRTSGGDIIVPESLVASYEAHRDEMRALAMQLVDHFAEQRQWRLSALFLDYALQGLLPKQRYVAKIKTILRYQEHPDSVNVYAQGGPTLERLRTVEGRRFLHQLRTAPEANAEVRQRADQMLAALDALAPVHRGPASRQSGSSSSGARLTFEPVELLYTDLRGQQRKLDSLTMNSSVRVSSGCLALDNNLDVLWNGTHSHSQVLVITQPGQARLLWSRSGWIRSLVHDGRYLWLTCEYLRDAPRPFPVEPELWVLDPVQRQAWQIGREHGLPLLASDDIPEHQPNTRPTAVVAPFAPGQAIVAGWIGRTWLAHVVFDPQGQHQVKVFHEARELPSTRHPAPDSEHWKSTSVAFRPGYALTFFEPQKAGQVNRRVLIGRNEPGLTSRPLVVGPSDLSVGVLEQEWYNVGIPEYHSDLHEHQLYYTGVQPPKWDDIQLFRLGLPDLQPVPVRSDIQEGLVLFEGETMHVVGREWWRGSPDDGRLESFGEVPWIFRRRFAASGPSGSSPVANRGELELCMIGRSNHYGIIVFCSEVQGSRRGLARVIFDGSGMSMDEVLDSHKRPRAAPATPAPTVLPTARPIPDSPQVLWKTPSGYAASAWSPDGKTIITVGSKITGSSAVQAWDAADGRLIADYPVEMTKVAFSPSGRYFATAAGDGLVMVWSTAELKPLCRLEGHQTEIHALAFSWDEQWLATSCLEWYARVWNVVDGEERLKVRDRKGVIRWLGFTPDGARLLTATHSGGARYWDLSSGQVVGNIESLYYPGGWLSDRKVLAVSDNTDNSLIVWNCMDDSSHRLWERTPGVPVAVSPDGRRFATLVSWAFADGERKSTAQMQVWDLATRRELLSQTYSSKPLSVTFSPDGKVLLVTSYSRELVRHELVRYALE